MGIFTSQSRHRPHLPPIRDAFALLLRRQRRRVFYRGEGLLVLLGSGDVARDSNR